MADKAWKRHERDTAAAFGGKRVSRGANFGDSLPDILHPTFSIECKFRKQIPKVLSDGLKQAKDYDETKTPILVIKEREMHGAIVCMYRDDFVELINK